MTAFQRRFVALVSGLILTLLVYAETRSEWPTPGEASHFVRYTQSDDVARFLSELDHTSEEMVVQVVGRSRATSIFGSRDLYLVILTAEGIDSPDELDRSRPTLLLIGSQHGNEQSAKEASLALIRDLTVGDLRPLLEEVNVLVMPQMNPYGNYVDIRRNEQDLDLNRDHVKLEAPQTEAIHRVFRRWMPEVTVDAHEKGNDYYQISYGCVSNANIHPSIQTFSREVILDEVATDLEKAQVTFHEYLITQRMGVESSAGAALPA
ncbi:MAG: DUF2817 domain-containing protein, partial [Thermoanaerobaculia bacterium]|nr:DUF2817 domain-containing protein [Thermoanaerobaculia bacterium]